MLPVEDEESLKSDAVLRQLADSFQHKVYDLLADRVVAAGVVVGRILLPADHLLRVEQATIRTHAYLVCSVQ